MACLLGYHEAHAKKMSIIGRRTLAFSVYNVNYRIMFGRECDTAPVVLIFRSATKELISQALNVN